MITLLLTVFSFASVIYFPAVITMLLALCAAFFDPLVPLAVGIFSDTLYWTPGISTVPYGTLIGLIACVIAFFVRNRLRSGTMR